VSSGRSLVAEGARQQLIHPAVYSPDYVRIAYPMGDIPPDKGACVDVVIRALRYAGYDLQALIQDGMKRRIATYPRREAHRDPNIDHRRVPNQMHFFARYGLSLPQDTKGTAGRTWQAGDLVYWKLPNGLDHCGVVSDRTGPRGL